MGQIYTITSGVLSFCIFSETYNKFTLAHIFRMRRLLPVDKKQKPDQIQPCEQQSDQQQLNVRLIKQIPREQRCRERKAADR